MLNDDVTPDRVRWFADYHRGHPNWGLWGPDGPGDGGRIDIVRPTAIAADQAAMVTWWNQLGTEARAELARRVATLELKRRADAPAPPDDLEARPRAPHVRQHAADVAAASADAARDRARALERVDPRHRLVLAWVERLVAAAGGPMTIAELLDAGKPPASEAAVRSRMTELYYMGIMAKHPARTCATAGRPALTWAPAALPWVPVTGRPTGRRALLVMLREASELLGTAADLPNPDPDHARLMRVASAEYRATAARELPDA